jgi:hypothetical protein
MGKVYRHGLCNIAACMGNTSDHSIFVERDSQVSKPLVTYQEFSDQVVKFTILPDWVNLTWDAAPLYKRGWVFQERFLASRIMHFTEAPFWECNAELTTESYSESQNIEFPSRPQSQRSWLHTKKSAEESVSCWWTLVKLYTRCTLTYSSDKLIALGGIASTLSNAIKAPYFAGIWGDEFLIPGLAWRVTATSQRHELGSVNYRGTVPNDIHCVFSFELIIL